MAACAPPVRGMCWQIGLCISRFPATFHLATALHHHLQALLCGAKSPLGIPRHDLQCAECLLCFRGVRIDCGATDAASAVDKKKKNAKVDIVQFIGFVAWQQLKPRQSVFVLCCAPQWYRGETSTPRSASPWNH